MPDIRDYVKEALAKGLSEKEINELFSSKGYSSKEISVALNSTRPVKKEDDYKIEELSLMKKIGLTFSDPKGFFDKVHDAGIGKSIFSLFLVSFCIFAIAYIGISLMSAIGGNYSIYSYFGIFYYIILFPISLIFIFIYAGISYFILRMSGGQGNYKDTFNALVYSLIPASILSIIPLVGLLSFIYSCFLMTFGFAKYHNVSYGRAVSAVLVPVLFVIVAFVFLIFYFFYAFRMF